MWKLETGVFAPKEAHEDRYIVTAGIAIVAIVGMLAMLQISFYNGLRYALVEIDHVQKTVKVVDIVEGKDASQFPEANEQPAHLVIYNPRFPQHFIRAKRLTDYKVDFWMSVGFLAVMLVAIIVFAVNIMKYIAFKKRMQRY